jgi:EAL and modified HD-GYP domain-containing signal transduction protein
MDLLRDTRDQVYVARQPILFSNGHVFGYELLYRGAAGDTSCVAAGDVAGARVLTDAFLNLGLEYLTDGRVAFVNLTRELLLAGAGELLPKSAVVLEMREDIEVDAEVIEACRRLQAKGYILALDDFEPGSQAEALVPFAEFVKVDVLLTTSKQRLDAARRFLPLGVTLLAEKVETEADVVEAKQAGYRLFQGYFFCRPSTIAGPSVHAERLGYMRMLAALNRPDAGIFELEEIIKADVSLSYRVLRSINSAAFAVRQEIRSIRQALVMLGTERIRQWASIWALAGVHTGGSPETMNLAVIRARCCEQIVSATDGADAGAEHFLLGLCSMLDVMLAKPMAEIVRDLPLGDPIREALTGTPNRSRALLDAVAAYERGYWQGAAEASVRAGIDFDAIRPSYENALRWSHELTRAAKAAA